MKELIFEPKFLVTLTIIVSVAVITSITGRTIAKGVANKVEKRISILNKVMETGKLPTEYKINSVRKPTVTCGVRG